LCREFRIFTLEVTAQGQRQGNFTVCNGGRPATGRPFVFFRSVFERGYSSILEISLSRKALPLETAIDSSARPNVCNEENLPVNRENYPIVADTRSSLVGANQGF
jgi:hypothetical protein